MLLHFLVSVFGGFQMNSFSDIFKVLAWILLFLIIQSIFQLSKSIGDLSGKDMMESMANAMGMSFGELYIRELVKGLILSTIIVSITYFIRTLF